VIFSLKNIELIQRGLKTQSRRLRWPRVVVGNRYVLRTGFFDREARGSIQVIGVYREHLGDISRHGARREGCRSPAAFLKMFRTLNAKRKVSCRSLVWVVTFRYVKPKSGS
jgi:hypothetical protein